MIIIIIIIIINQQSTAEPAPNADGYDLLQISTQMRTLHHRHSTTSLIVWYDYSVNYTHTPSFIAPARMSTHHMWTTSTPAWSANACRFAVRCVYEYYIIRTTDYICELCQWLRTLCGWVTWSVCVWNRGDTPNTHLVTPRAGASPQAELHNIFVY